MTTLRRQWLLPIAVAAVLAVLGVLAGGCGWGAAAAEPPGVAVQPVASGTAGPAGSRATVPDPPVTRAREGRPAPSERVRFRPERLTLSRGGRAEVDVASTVDGELRVPDDVRHLGWWDGGAYAGDPFGSTVIAGHVDSKTQGLGFFARLMRAERGDEVTLSGEGHSLRYRVTGMETVTKRALAADGAAFEQARAHRLVLITCGGDYEPGRGYDSNLIIYAEPLGLAR